MLRGRVWKQYIWNQTLVLEIDIFKGYFDSESQPRYQFEEPDLCPIFSNNNDLYSLVTLSPCRTVKPYKHKSACSVVSTLYTKWFRIVPVFAYIWDYTIRACMHGTDDLGGSFEVRDQAWMGKGAPPCMRMRWKSDGSPMKARWKRLLFLDSYRPCEIDDVLTVITIVGVWAVDRKKSRLSFTAKNGPDETPPSATPVQDYCIPAAAAAVAAAAQQQQQGQH